jgi:hypothetical protein
MTDFVISGEERGDNDFAGASTPSRHGMPHKTDRVKSGFGLRMRP